MVEEMLLALCSTLSPLMLDKDWSEVKGESTHCSKVG